MSYKVLYRKYRPTNFDDLVGQEVIKKILTNSIVNNEISHAYIFSGPRGTGKTTTARILAKTINCSNNKSGIACDKCQNCLNFDNNPDIIEIDAASNNGVDEIRELINNVKLMPTSSKYKVYIIDEVHMLSQSAFNALLLTLEEPPAHVVFILATTNIESVPITILSRCQKYEFNRINDDLIVGLLKKICDKENIKYTEDGLKEIAALSDGGARDALSILDQLSKEKQEITEQLVNKEVGSVSLKYLNDLFDYIDKNDVEKVIELLNRLKDSNVNYKVVIKKLIDILASKAVEILENLEYRLSYTEIKNLIFELNDCLNNININVNPYTLIKMILLNYVDNSKNQLKSEKKEEKNKLKEIKNEQEIKIENELNPDNYGWEIDKKLIEIRMNNCFANASKENLEEIKNKWNIFVNKDCKNKTKGIVMDTEIVAASDEYAIITGNMAHQVEEINMNVDSISSEFNNNYKLNYKFVAFSEEEWKIQKQEYIKNIKKGKKYIIQDEKKLQKNEKQDNIMEEIASELFEKDKLEIKGE